MRRLLLPLGVVLGTALLVGVLVVGFLLTLQRMLIYLPDRTAPPPAATVLPGARDVTLRTTDGLELGAWYVPPTGAGPDRQVTVLLAPGNGGNRADRAPVAEQLADDGLAVLLVDYRGYGGNPGRPSEEGLALDVRAAHRYLTDEVGVASHRLVYFGESLGAAAVTELATEHPPGGLLLRSPFVDLASVGEVHYPILPVRQLLREYYPVADQISRVHVPTVVVYGEADRIVPPDQSRLVAASAPRLIRTIPVMGAGHNDPDLFVGSDIRKAVEELVKRLPEP